MGEIFENEVREAQILVQEYLDEVTRKLGTIGDIVTNAISAGMRREGLGRLASVHLEDAIAVLSVITRNSKGRDPQELVDEIAMVDRCLARAAAEMKLDYHQM